MLQRQTCQESLTACKRVHSNEVAEEDEEDEEEDSD